MSNAEKDANGANHSSPMSDDQTGTVDYVCPKHPELHSDEPGRCPIDGTFLEKRTVETLTEEGAQ